MEEIEFLDKAFPDRIKYTPFVWENCGILKINKTTAIQSSLPLEWGIFFLFETEFETESREKLF